MTRWALVPARCFGRAKSRLGDWPGRPATARAFFERVVEACAAVCDGVLVATDGDDVAEVAKAHGARVLKDEGPRPLSAVVDRGLSALLAHGAEVGLVVMGDLPLLTAAQLADMLAALSDADLVLGPDRQGLGTNALAVRLPAPLATCFGNVDSLARHLAAADAGRLRAVLVAREGIAFDVDVPGDLQELGTTSSSP